MIDPNETSTESHLDVTEQTNPEENFAALTLESENATPNCDLASIIKTKPDRATRDRFYNSLSNIPKVEALKMLIDLLQITTLETGFTTETFEAWDYLTSRKLWESVDPVLDQDQAHGIFGMPIARANAKEKIQLNWGVPAKNTFPVDIRPPFHSSILLCLLSTLSEIINLETANIVFTTWVSMRNEIWQNSSVGRPESPYGSDTYSTDNETTDYKLFKDEQPRSYTRSEGVSKKPFVLFWDLLDTLDSLAQNSFLSDILAEITEGVSLLSSGIELYSVIPSESPEYPSESEEETAASLPIEFPCLCTYQTYDKLGFHGFPTRKGWVIQQDSNNPLERMDGTKFSDAEASTFIQGWLFFGTLIEIFDLFRIHVRPQDFIRFDGSDARITFIFMDIYLESWLRVLKDQDHHSSFKEAMSILSILDEYTTESDPLDRYEALDPVIQLSEILRGTYTVFSSSKSIEELRYELRYELCSWFGDAPTTEFSPDAVDGENGKDGEWYIIDYEKMKEAGWCPKEINKLFNDAVLANNWYFYYASTLDRRISGRSHGECSKSSCLLQTVDDTQYETKHHGTCTGCRHVSVAIDRILAILHAGEVARISISSHTVAHQSPSDTSLEISVVNEGPYVAISHVWSDGLGNPCHNSLPTCQLLRLKRQAAQLLSQDSEEEPTTIWIDTLCVPVQPEGRKLALTQLGKAYMEANYVLVLDCELQLATVECRQEEQLMRIILSGWAQRLWTLEEAVFGRDRLFFQFLEGAVPLSESITSQSQDYWDRLGGSDVAPNLSRHIAVVAMDLFPHLSAFELQDLKPPDIKLLVPPFVQYEGQGGFFLLAGMQLRKTTKIEDQYLCAASLMRIDIRSIAQSNSALERSRAFYTVLAERRVPVPAQILFSEEPKLPIHGYRWTPASLLSQSAYPLLHPEISGWYFCPDGIYCRYPAYTFENLPEALSDYLWIETSHQQNVELWQPASCSWVDLTKCLPSVQTFEIEGERHISGRFVLLLNRTSDVGSKANSNNYEAVLAFVYRFENTGPSPVFYARYIQAIRKVRPLEDLDCGLDDLENPLHSNKSVQVEVLYTSPVDWCIG